MTRQRVAQLAAAATIGTTTLFWGLASANALPGAAQGVASDMLAKVGVSVPNPNSHAGTHPDTRGNSASHDTQGNAPTAPNGKGSTISNLAHTTTATGVNKGAVISSTASGGKSHAGQHAPTSAPATSGAPFATPPFSVPPTQGTPTSTPPVSTPPVSTPPVSLPSQAHSGHGH